MSDFINVEKRLPKLEEWVECRGGVGIENLVRVDILKLIKSGGGFAFVDMDGDIGFPVKEWRPILKPRKITFEFFRFEDRMPEENRKILVPAKSFDGELLRFFGSNARLLIKHGYKEWAYAPEELNNE